MIEKFEKDIKELSELSPLFWSLEEEVIMAQLDKFLYNYEYGAYLRFHKVRFVSVNVYSYTSVSISVNGKYQSVSLDNLPKILFSTELSRLYTIHQIKNG